MFLINYFYSHLSHLRHVHIHIIYFFTLHGINREAPSAKLCRQACACVLPRLHQPNAAKKPNVCRQEKAHVCWKT